MVTALCKARAAVGRSAVHCAMQQGPNLAQEATGAVLVQPLEEG
jgi:hypothetical protein